MELTAKDFVILRMALGDARDHQAHILEALSTAREKSGFRNSIRERTQLVDDYWRLDERLKEATVESGRRCECCGEPSTDRFCGSQCYNAHVRQLEATATLPILRDHRARPPRSSPDK